VKLAGRLWTLDADQRNGGTKQANASCTVQGLGLKRGGAPKRAKTAQEERKTSKEEKGK